METRGETVVEVLSRTVDFSISNLVEALIWQAYTMRASDIHVDPTDTTLKIRIRVDGVLQESFLLQKNIHAEVISRIKVLAWLRTDEHQAAQDGRFRVFKEGFPPIDVRVSITPTYFGENAVLRLLAEAPESHTLASLGFATSDQERIIRAITRPCGMVLATGPTGSGKTTTLYTIVRMLNTKETSIVSIEDPIEYSITGVTQIQVQPKTGLTFAAGLRAILRQDPNIIMVGEIRDAETAKVSVNAALTGHLVLSTLHTSDAAATLPRLLDMGVDAYLVASTVSVAIGQRLLRTLCQKCKRATALTDIEYGFLQKQAPELVSKNERFFIGTGCDQCSGTGYMGRIGIYEVLVVDRVIHDAILARAAATDIRTLAIQNGMTTLFQDGIRKARAGSTSIAEVLRTVYE